MSGLFLALLSPLFAGEIFPEEVDWQAAGRETTALLSGYLQVDTTNPPGNETAGAEYLAAFLEAQGIETRIIESAPGRGNLVARIEGSTEAPPLCLLSHIDVVSAEPEAWPPGRGPLSGTLDEEGMLWGRGALDMKGMGALEAMVLVLLKRHEVPLQRDVILVAVADEEIDGTGIRTLLEDHWEELGCSHVINEGGIGLEGMFFDDQAIYPISVGEKGVLWLKMVASGEPGHGSTPRPGTAPARLLAATEAIQGRKPRPQWNPALLELLASAGSDHGGLSGAILRRPWLARLLLRKRLMENPLTRAALTDTVNITGFGGANQPNVIPGEAWALLDCRLQPGTTAEAMLAELTDLVDDPHVRFEVLSSMEAAVSPWDDPLYEALVQAANETGGVAGPVISVGFTDSIYLRPLGVRAYGLVPFVVSEELVATMHGNGERVSTENLERGLQVLTTAVVAFAGSEN